MKIVVWSLKHDGLPDAQKCNLDRDLGLKILLESGRVGIKGMYGDGDI
jgi:hypothetical protein